MTKTITIQLSAKKAREKKAKRNKKFLLCFLRIKSCHYHGHHLSASYKKIELIFFQFKSVYEKKTAPFRHKRYQDCFEDFYKVIIFVIQAFGLK